MRKRGPIPYWPLSIGLVVISCTGLYFWLNPTYEKLNGHGRLIKSLAFFPEGHDWLTSASVDGKIGMWDLKNGTVSFLAVGKGVPTSLSFSVDKKKLFVGVDETAIAHEHGMSSGVDPDGFKVLVYDWQTKQRTKEINGLASAPTCLVRSKHRPYLAIISGRQIVLWNTDTWQRIATLEARSLGGKPVAFVDNGQQLVFANEPHSINEYDVASGVTKRIPFGQIIEGIVATEEQKESVVVLTSSGLYKVDLVAEEVTDVVIGFEDGMVARDICLLEKQKLYAVGVMEQGEITFRRARVLLFDGDTFAIKRRFTGIPGGVTAIAVSTDGVVLACAGFEPTITLLYP